MSAEFFVCTVERKGYEFQNLPHFIEDKEYRVLAPRVTGTERFGRQFPLFVLHPLLWREFVELKPTEEAISAFASKYGALFPKAEKPLTKNPRLSKPKSPSILVQLLDGSPDSGELLKTWKVHIDEMKRLSDLWDLLREKDTHGLEQHLIAVTPDQRNWVYAPSRLFVMRLRNRTLTPQDLENPRVKSLELPANFVNPKLEDAAREMLRESINAKLLRIHPKILWEVPEWNKPDTARRHLSLRLIPNSLIDALWLQFAQAITRDTKFERCVRCKKWFAVEGKNSHKKLYCGNACKQAVHREVKSKKLA